MALGNFFEKNALAAHQILGGMSRKALESLLESEVVGLAVDEAATASLEGRRTAELAADIFARLYPRLSFISLGASSAAERLVARLEGRARAINPDIEFETSGETRVLVVGNSPYERDATTVAYVGSDDWSLRFSPANPVGSSSSGNPFGAGAAACLGAANVFRAVLGGHLPKAQMDQELDVSVIDWGAPFDGATRPDLDSSTIDVSETVLGGLGAIGSAAVWALARVPRLTGTLRLVDSESVEISNLQRYVLTEQTSVGAAKVTIAAGEVQRFQRDALTVTEHPLMWRRYLAERDNWDIPRLATAFDTEEARVHAQGALPQSLLNAWTQLGDLGVSRHTQFGIRPCISCLYAPKTGGRSEAEQVAHDLGFDGAPYEIRQLLYTQSPVAPEFVLQVAENLKVTDPNDVEVLVGHAGKPLRAFHAATVCGGVMLELGLRPGERPAHVPMAFQSALAGIMLAAEIVLDSVRWETGQPYQGPTRTVLDLLRPIPVYPHPPMARRSGCICSDSDYLRAYREKYELFNGVA